MAEEVPVFSIDGRVFEFDAPISGVLPLGGFVEIRADGGRHLGQVVSEQAVVVSRLEPPRVSGSGIVVGNIDSQGRVSEPETGPFGGATLISAAPETIRSHLARAHPDRVIMEIGTSLVGGSVPATLHPAGFTRHSFVCGQSGSGKTYTMGVLLERLLTDTDLRIVVLDYNSDYVHLGKARPVFEVGIPEHAQRATRERMAEVVRRVQVFGGDALPLKIWFGNLAAEQQALALELDPLADAEEYEMARRVAAEFDSQDYGLHELRDRAAASSEPAGRRLRLRIENLGLLDLSIWAAGNEQPVRDLLSEDWRAVVFDLGSLGTPAERTLIAAGVLKALWEARRAREPFLLVVDEAHNLCPQQPLNRAQRVGTDHMTSIAGEGRKFGLYLMVATQRPQKVHENVLSQCGNLILMKMNSAIDIETVASAFSFVSPALVEMSPGFRLGEGLVAGPIVNSPLLFRTGERYTPEGGSDVPTTWASR